MQDTSVGKYRAFEAGLRLKNRKAFRKGRSERFLYAADQIDRFDKFSEIQKFIRFYEYQSLVDKMETGGEITSQESENLTDYLENKYPGGVAPESSLEDRRRWADYRVHTTIPIETDNKLVNIGQQHLGLGEDKQKFQIQELLRRGNIECNPQTTPWCAGYVASMLEQAGYEGLKGADRLRARKYARLGTRGTGEVGDLAVFRGHVGIVADRMPARDNPWYIADEVPEGAHDILMLGGNQGDAINLKKIPYTDFQRPDFLGFRTPVEKKQRPQKITSEKWIPPEK